MTVKPLITQAITDKNPNVKIKQYKKPKPSKINFPKSKLK